jgi:hypothetical protein
MNIKIINTFLLTYISMGNVIGNLKPCIPSTEFKIIVNLGRRPPADVFFLKDSSHFHIGLITYHLVKFCRSGPAFNLSIIQTITNNFICYFIMSFFFHVLSHNLCQPYCSILSISRSRNLWKKKYLLHKG